MPLCHYDRIKLIGLNHHLPDMSQSLLIPGFLSRAEAQEQRARLDSLGWQPAPVRFASGTQSAPRLRNSERVEFTDTALASELWSRLAQLTTPEKLLALANEPHGPLALRSWFRGYRYLPGQRFGKHRDAFETDGPWVSRVTALIYLTDSTDGDGATILYPDPGSEGPIERVAPQSGALLLFHSRLLHEGESPALGEKIVLRSDLLFAK